MTADGIPGDTKKITNFRAPRRKCLKTAHIVRLQVILVLLLTAVLQMATPRPSHAQDTDENSPADIAQDVAERTSDQVTRQVTEQAAQGASDRAVNHSLDQALRRATDQSASEAAQEDHAATGEALQRSLDRGDEAAQGQDEDSANNISEKTPDLRAAAVLPVTLDRSGTEILPDEIVVLADPAQRAALTKAGLVVLSATPLPALGGTLLQLRSPNGETLPTALTAIHSLAPDAAASANHVYRLADGPSPPPLAPRPLASPASPRPAAAVVGIIDSLVDPSYPGLGGKLLGTQSFAPGLPPDASHGTAVAMLLAQGSVRVLAANVFSLDGQGEAGTSTGTIVTGLDWLLSRGVRIINMSLEGPMDPVLGEAIRRAEAKGCVIVAAAGNLGPAAPPSYPAAFPGVIAVTAIDRDDHIYRYANSGDYISFAALGVDVVTALPPNAQHLDSGTSFAAPVVAALVARLAGPADTPATIMAALQARAQHLGTPGRNPVFGYGALN